ncbi:hypothetical protein NDU88_003056 [Pleurodeles waltl]|uniref:Uncharacterized protein n=1 Tax=Pleurodeles waltl TaxID=8319 RepID=A0AAV7T4F4_PLEWA|nr:hypothetical protein NDU88_003056 [Pleurodeles waltl]
MGASAHCLFLRPPRPGARARTCLLVLEQMGGTGSEQEPEVASQRRKTTLAFVVCSTVFGGYLAPPPLLPLSGTSDLPGYKCHDYPLLNSCGPFTCSLLSLP